MPIDFMTCAIAKSGDVRSPKGKLSYPHLFTPQANDDGVLFYELNIIMPPGINLEILKGQAKQAVIEKWGSDPAKWPAGLKTPFLDAEAVGAGKEGYAAGWTVMRPKTKQKPGIVNAHGQPVTDESEVYPGRWACVTFSNPYAYDKKGNKGVGFGLQNVQLLDHDDPIAGRSRPDDDFEYEAGGAENADEVFSSGDTAAGGDSPGGSDPFPQSDNVGGAVNQDPFG